MATPRLSSHYLVSRLLVSLFLVCLLLLFGGARAARACGCSMGNCSGCACGCGGEGTGGGLGNPNPAAAGSNFNSQNVTLASWLPLDQIGGAGKVGSAIWGWTDAGDNNREYALYGLSNGTAFIEVTDPFNPRYLGMMATQTGESVWRELQTYNDHLYVVSDANGGHGMQVFDLKNLRSVGATPATFAPTFVYGGVSNVHTLTINTSTGYAYLNGSSDAQQVVSLLNPAQPVKVASYGRDGYTHDSTVVSYRGPDAAYAGREIAINYNGTSGIAIVDMTDKANITTIKTVSYPGLGYGHQGAITEDQRFLLVDDEFDELNNAGDPAMRTKTHVWDIRDLDNPVWLGAFTHEGNAIDHNMFIRGDLVYQSNYTSGLRVFRLGDLQSIADAIAANPLLVNDQALLGTSLVSLGFFDTYPQDDASPEVSFNGQWGNYPFFPSGTVIAGDRNNGLFVFAAAVPEPSTLALAALGGAVAVLGGTMRRWGRS